MAPAFEISAAFATGLAVGALSALAGIGGGVLLVPFLYLIYSSADASPSAQTLVAHATSLGVAFVASTAGTWRYARAGAVVWRAALTYSVPGVIAAFVTARVLTRVEQTLWVRAAFGLFLLISAASMVNRARRHTDNAPIEGRTEHSWNWLIPVGLVGGAVSALLGVGGGLIAVPVLLHVGQLPVKAVAPTALTGVCLTTLAGGLAYLTAGSGPQVSPAMVGFLDLRMALPLALGALVSVPLGVRVNRRSSPPTLYWFFGALFSAIGLWLIIQWIRT